MSLSRFRRAGLVVPTVLALAALAVLLALGTWQLQRKDWKDALTASIRARTTAAPAGLADPRLAALIASAAPGPDGTLVADWSRHPLEYLRVAVTGRFRHEGELYLYAPDQRRGPGWHIYTPLQLAEGRWLMVNRGYVPERLKAPAQRAAGQPSGAVEVVGLVRAPGEPGAFTPANDPGRNQWYWRDVAAMRKAALPADVPGKAVLPFVLDAAAEPANPGGWPAGGTTIVELPNRHLEYALTWYGLALTLIGVYAAFARVRLAALPGG